MESKENLVKLDTERIEKIYLVLCLFSSASAGYFLAYFLRLCLGFSL